MTAKPSKAKKSSSPKKKVAKTKIAKKTMNKKGARKTTAKTATASKKKVSKKRAKSPRAKTSSVDNILQGFEIERVTQSKQLTTVEKKIKEVTTKIKSFEKQLSTLQKTRLQTEEAIATIDARRDAQIGKLLGSLGINLDNAAQAAEKLTKKKVDKPTPLFDLPAPKPTAKDKKPAGEKSADTDKSPAADQRK